MRQAVVIGLVVVGSVLAGLLIGFLTADQPPAPQQAEAPATEIPAAETPSEAAAPALEESQPEAAAEAETAEPTRQPLAPTALGADFAAAEAALAGPDLLALAHFDLAALGQVERAFMGEGDPDALAPPLVDPDSLRQRLAADGIYLDQQIDHALAGVFQDDATGQPGFAVLLVGRLPVEQLTETLEATYETERFQESGNSFLRIRRRNPDSCSLSAPVVLHLTPERALFGSLQQVTAVLARLNTGAAAAQDLAKWQRLREGRIFSFATLVSPQRLIEGLEPQDPISSLALSAGGDDFNQLEALEGGLTLEALPFLAEFSLAITGAQEEWIAAKTLEMATGMAALKTGLGKNLPSLSSLAERLTIQRDGLQLAFTLRLDESTFEDFQRLPGEVLGLMFGGFGLSADDLQPGETQPEQLLEPERLITYRSRVDPSRLAGFDTLESPPFQAAVTTGPFGLRIKGVRLHAEDSQVLEVEIEATSAALPNAARDDYHGVEGREPVTLSVSRVTGRDGQQLLRPRDCGPSRNDQATVLTVQEQGTFIESTWHLERRAAGSKSLRLLAGTRLAEVATIEGTLEWQLGNRTETLTLSAPFEGQVVERNGFRVAFRKAGPSNVTYSVSGEGDRLLDLRALNAKGQYLSPAGTMASGGGGAERKLQRDFAGEIAKIELIIATEMTTLQFPFSLEGSSPAFETWNFPEPHQVPLTDLSAFEAAVEAQPVTRECSNAESQARAAPFQVCLGGRWAYFGQSYQLRFDLLAPEVPTLDRSLSALEVVVETVETASGPVPFAASGFANFAWGMNGEGYLDSLNLAADLPEGVSEDALTGLNGRLVLRLPQEFEVLSLDIDDLGARVEDPAGAFLQLTGFENGALALVTTLGRERLVQFRAFTEDGAEIATRLEDIQIPDDGTPWSIRLATSGRPARLEAVLAADATRKDYPFKLSFAE